MKRLFFAVALSLATGAFAADPIFQLGIWSHGQRHASVSNEFTGEPVWGHLFDVLHLGGGFGKKVSRTSVSRDSRWIAAELEGGKAALWNVETQREYSVEIPTFYIFSLEFSPSGKQLLLRLTSKKDYGVQVWDLKTQRPASAFIPARGGSYPRSRFTGDGRYLLVDNEQVTRIFDTTTYADTGRTVPNSFNYRLSGHY